MRGAIAAGHPLTAEAGARVLREGGNAVDALLAAAFAAFVTEGPLTGPAGGGLLLVHEASGETTLLDCFFAVPAERLGEMDEVLIDFEDAGTQTFHVGEGSVAVPGLLAGLEEAHRRFATRPWPELVEPALELARAAASTATSRARSCTGSSRGSSSARRAAGASTATPRASSRTTSARRSSESATSERRRSSS